MSAYFVIDILSIIISNTLFISHRTIYLPKRRTEQKKNWVNVFGPSFRQQVHTPYYDLKHVRELKEIEGL